MKSKIKIRKQIRDFEGSILLMEKTSLKDLEEMFLEIYEFNLQESIKREKQKNPELTRKEIIINMHKLHDELKNSGRNMHNESL
ncbi:MAG: hypothetical protein GF311_11535 [Candidatus Lokiarchaeota archaeon]|nr:hypothetical protein [Candidatus Lokiarchaeota archaeon]